MTTDPSPDQQQVAELNTAVSVLRARVETLEVVGSRIVMAAAGLGITLGLLLPYARLEAERYDDPDPQPETLRMVSIAFRQFAFRTEDGDHDSRLTTAGVCFVVLLVVAVAALLLLLRIWPGRVPGPWSAILSVVAVLGALSAAGAWAILPMSWDGTYDVPIEISAGPGLVCYTFGMLALVAVSRTRDWWS